MKPYYEEKGIKLFLGDFREVLPVQEEGGGDLLLTDPPYNTTNLLWDKAIDWLIFWKIIERLCRVNSPMVLFASGLFTVKLINSNRKYFRYDLIWEKSMPTGFLDAKRRPLRSHENILVFVRKFRGSTYNPQMIRGKLHKRGGRGSIARQHATQRATAGNVSNQYYPRSVLRFPNARGGARSLHPTPENPALV